MPVLNSQVVADKYPLSTGGKGAILANVWNSRGGWFSVTGATAFVQLQYGDNAQDHWVEEIFLGAGAFVVVPPNCRGIQFRNGVAGVNATVTAQIAQGDEPPLAISTIGQTNTVLVSSLNFQHNDLAVATEPTADFEDSTALQFTLTDDPANTRVKIGLLNVSLADKASASQQLFTGQVGSGAGSTAVGAAAGTDMTPGGLFASASAAATTSALTTTVTADTTDYRFKVRADGQLTWASGSANADVTLARSAANQLDLGTTTQEGKLRLFGAAAGDLALQLLVTTDANPRLAASYAGALNWGGGTLATDVSLARSSAGNLTLTGGLFASGSVVSGMGGDGASPLFNAIGAAAGGALNSGGVLQVSRATNNVAITITNPAATTDWRWQVSSDGVIKWAAANTAADITLGRATPPTGTGASLLLTAVPGGFGYGTGTGGTATITSGSSGTINKPTGKVTAAASVANGATGSYTVTNSVVGNDDVVVVCIVAGGGNAQTVFAKIGSGTFTIDYANNSGVAQTPVFTFAVIKGAVA